MFRLIGVDFERYEMNETDSKQKGEHTRAFAQKIGDPNATWLR